MVKPAFPLGASLPDIKALLKRASFILNTEEAVYVRMAGAKSEVRRLVNEGPALTAEGSTAWKAFLEDDSMRDETILGPMRQSGNAVFRRLMALADAGTHGAEGPPGPRASQSEQHGSAQVGNPLTTVAAAPVAHAPTGSSMNPVQAQFGNPAPTGATAPVAQAPSGSSTDPIQPPAGVKQERKIYKTFFDMSFGLLPGNRRGQAIDLDSDDGATPKRASTICEGNPRSAAVAGEAAVKNEAPAVATIVAASSASVDLTHIDESPQKRLRGAISASGSTKGALLAPSQPQRAWAHSLMGDVPVEHLPGKSMCLPRALITIARLISPEDVARVRASFESETARSRPGALSTHAREFVSGHRCITEDMAQTMSPFQMCGLHSKPADNSLSSLMGMVLGCIAITGRSLSQMQRSPTLVW